MDSTIFVPTVTTGPRPVPPPPPPTPSYAAQLSALIRQHPQQKRTLQEDSRLIAAAQAWADDMGTRQWVGHHTPEGITPNQWVRRYGFNLPRSYSWIGNQVQSAAEGTEAADVILRLLWESALHRAHIWGEGWFRHQDRIGVGFAVGKQSTPEQRNYHLLWCIFIAKEAV